MFTYYLIVAMFCLGLFLVVEPYISGLAARSRSGHSGSRASGGARFEAVESLMESADRVRKLLPLNERLAAAGSDETIASFRARQLRFGAVGLGCGVLLVSLSELFGSSYPLAVMAAAILAGALLPPLAMEEILKWQATKRRARVEQQLPEAADLLALAVVAGESLRAALHRTAKSLGGPLGEELAVALHEASSGTPLAACLRKLGDRIRTPGLTRFVDAVIRAQERGTPLSESLHAIAAEVRDADRRRLIEEAASRQVLMLVPVVMLILPTALAFAFFPGFFALRFFVR